MNNNYLTECKQLLQAFELTQAHLLRFELNTAVEEFRLEIAHFSELFIDMSASLSENKSFSGRHRLLLQKQTERLLIYLKELHGSLYELTDKKKPDGLKLIHIFERQYKFKTILKNHLNDFTEPAKI